MVIVCDSREQAPLQFPTVKGVEVRPEAIDPGDYAAIHAEGVWDTTRIERKGISDLFHSFTGEPYDYERAKILRAKDQRLQYVLAIEATFSEVLRGHAYWKDGEYHEVKRTGLSLVRMLMTIQRKYQISVWWCAGRKEMALRVLEFFLAQERVQADP